MQRAVESECKGAIPKATVEKGPLKRGRFEALRPFKGPALEAGSKETVSIDRWETVSIGPKAPFRTSGGPIFRTSDVSTKTDSRGPTPEDRLSRGPFRRPYYGP